MHTPNYDVTTVPWNILLGKSTNTNIFYFVPFFGGGRFYYHAGGMIESSSHQFSFLGQKKLRGIVLGCGIKNSVSMHQHTTYRLI